MFKHQVVQIGIHARVLDTGWLNQQFQLVFSLHGD